jgi:hypothetical protein
VLPLRSGWSARNQPYSRRGSSHDTARLAVNPFCHLERQVTTSSCHRLARPPILPTVAESDYPLPCRSLECFAPVMHKLQICLSWWRIWVRSAEFDRRIFLQAF